MREFERTCPYCLLQWLILNLRNLHMLPNPSSTCGCTAWLYITVIGQPAPSTRSSLTHGTGKKSFTPWYWCLSQYDKDNGYNLDTMVCMQKYITQEYITKQMTVYQSLLSYLHIWYTHESMSAGMDAIYLFLCMALHHYILSPQRYRNGETCHVIELLDLPTY